MCVYLPAFLAIHLKSSAAEGPSVVLIARDLLLAYKEVDLPVFEAIWKHFVQHASQWLSPKNIALSVHAEALPYTVDAVKEKGFPRNVDIQQALLKRKQLRDFFTEEQEHRFLGGGGGGGVGGADPPKDMHWGGPKSKGSPNKNKHVCYLSWILTK